MRKIVSLVVPVSQQCSTILWAEEVTAILNYRSCMHFIPSKWIRISRFYGLCFNQNLLLSGRRYFLFSEIEKANSTIQE